MRLFIHLYKNVLRVRNFGKTKAVRVIFFPNFLKFKLDFQNSRRNGEKFSVAQIIASELEWLNCPYEEQDIFVSTANVLTRSPKILNVNKRDVSKHNFLVSEK